MLTKKEREKIVERCKRYFYSGETDICRYLVGHSLLDDATDEERCKAVINCIRDFCDTSNMVELPYDKNGEIIYIDDDMVDEFGCQIVVTSIEFFDDCTSPIITCRNTEGNIFRYYSGSLVHNHKSKHERLAERLDMIAAADLNSKDVAKQLLDIAGKLRNLDCGDNDD